MNKIYELYQTINPIFQKSKKIKIAEKMFLDRISKLYIKLSCSTLIANT